jgi:hypothetical protein
VVLAGDNYVDEPSVGDKDPCNAMMIEQNIAPVSALDDPDSRTGYINRWVSSDISSHLLAWFLHDQYSTGWDANDYVLLRFNGVLLSNAYTHHDIFSPRYYDPNYRPYIEYELVDANEGNWRLVTLGTPTTIVDTGVLADPPGSLGCFDIGGAVYKNAELMLPFQFPQLQSGEYIREVELSGIWGGRSRSAGFDADLYGLPYRSGTAFVSSDYWVGPYAPQTGDVPNMNSGTPLESDVFGGFAISAGQEWSLGSEGLLRMACYMNDLKTAGATSSDYGFLRFGERFDFYNYQRNSISDFTMWAKVATIAPSCPGVPDTEGACLGYDNPDGLSADTDGDCMVTFQDMAVMAERWMQCAAVPASNCP